MSYSISDFLPFYPNIEDSDFNVSIKSKHEFRKPTIENKEDFPSKKGELFSHQVLISRLMSSRTPYDGVLLMHEMGTGKTCSASAIIQQVRSENNGIDNFIYVAKNKSLLDNFDDEFRGKCTVDDYSQFKKLNQIGIQKLTYDSFVKTYQPKSPSNCVIIIDEIHNIRGKNSYEDKGTYGSFYKILKQVTNAKIILLSGTPIIDKPNEIASVMNLILPENKKLPIGSDFDKRFIDKNGKITETQELIEAFSGRISYIKSLGSVVRKVFIGDKPDTLKHFVIDSSDMSQEQTDGYTDALKNDEDGASPAFSNSLQAGDIVIEGKYGVKLKNLFLKGNTYDEKIKDLEKYSSKYASSIRTILTARKEGKNVFVFNKHVDGGGLKMFASILKKFGFTEATKSGIDKIDKEANRFLLLTGAGGVETTALERIGGSSVKGWGSDLGLAVKRFNNEDNVNGKMIGVVLASEAISEGYSFNNVQVIDIHSPWFNFQKISQVISRGIRAGSHRGIIKQKEDSDEDFENIDVDIHLRVSIPKDQSKSKYPSGIDTYTYETAESKDIIVKQIERIIKENAIDSYLARKRNFRDKSLDNSRDCDYTTCKYKSFPDMNIKTSVQTDFSTYELYYNAQDEKIIKAILEMFEEEDTYSLSLSDIINKYGGTIKRPIVNALVFIVNEDIPINQTNGDIFFLREQNNIYYLVKTISNKSTILDVYYTENKHEETIPENTESDDVFNLDNVTNVQSLNFKMRTLSIIEKETILENNIPSGNKYVLEKFGGLWGKIENVTYSWFLMTKKGSGRVLNDDNKWVDCTEEQEEIIRNYVIEIKKTLVDKALSIFKNS